MPFALAKDNARIHYRSFGNSDSVVVLVQGLGLSSRFWFSLPEELASDPLRPRRVLTLDNRGVGQSDTPNRPWSMKTMANDVLCVMDAAGVKRAAIVGISMGGMIAQHVAIQSPSRITGLVLLATLPGWPHARPASLSTVYKLTTLPFRKKQGFSTLAELLLPCGASLDLLKDWPAALRDEPARPKGFVRQLGAVCTHITPLALRKIHCPTVVIAGDEDKVVPLRNAKSLAKQIPGARLEIIRACAHAIPVIDREVISRCLRDL
jgi:3-oxoadipate enol-lactonase